ncbi:epidermal growth factor receptor substrate 15-like 1 isoform X4 [Tribolium madens]|uniref:epidermal growth factor receptor substrate 15-like 1 isoform X4 n=1 Tax=Tribolium madens TaxID=41895 RepID=UPI001CF72659|nr:epidermal growth factor receptor substrate 15-like 1 isoform X4 [Tribolium madens]
MAALPSPTQVAGNHSAIYEAYYNVVDPNGFGTVGGMEAARFLKRSGLSDVILSKIWDLSDPGGRGCLDKSGMFVALKLVALVQNGRDLSVSNINVDVPPPKMGDIPLPKPVKPPPPSNSPLITSLPPSAVDWTVKPSEREKYDKLFDSLQPTNGLIPGNKVKNVLLDSKLPFETLGKIWDLADQDKDGMLDRHEFIAAMHLVYKALDKFAIPNTLPPELMPPAKTKNHPPLVAPLLSKGLDGVKPDIPPPPAAAVAAPKPVQSVQPTIPWVVTPDEKAKSDALFIKSDIDKDGFVSGQEIKNVFLQSGVPQPVLAHIWALCDIKQSGKLNNEQFALAMWFVARCLKGVEPPTALTPDMVPPSFRTKAADGLVENNNTRYSNPELDMISKDIEELAREKLALETDIAQKEADIKIKSGEIKSLQSELDTLAATLKQLENQKGEAQKRLNDLRAQVDKLRAQAAEQAEQVAAQEAELNSKKQQLEGLRLEEQRLEQQKRESDSKLQSLTSNLQETQLSISQAKALITQLQEQTRQMNDAIEACDTAIQSGDANSVPDTALSIKPDFRDPEYTKVGLVNGNSNKQNGFGDGKDDPFSSKENGTNFSSGFGDDLFNNDSFKNTNAFEQSDPFNSAFSKSNDGFSSDPFGGSSFNTGAATKADPFDAFGDSQKSADSTVEPDKDPFGCDPFAVLHAPTRDGAAPPRPTSPSPALPPKKSKQPPPRPAPPRPAQPPTVKRSSQPDLFGNDAFTSSGGFADFSNFESKCLHYSHVIGPTPPSQNPLHSPFSTTKPTDKTAQTKGLDFTDDPFRDYRYEDPFNIKFDDEPVDVKGSLGSEIDTFGFPKSEKFDPFGLDGRQSVPLPGASTGADPFSGRASAPIPMNEDLQLAWAARESLKLEEDRKKRQLQEQADLELAISLSKAENKKL